MNNLKIIFNINWGYKEIIALLLSISPYIFLSTSMISKQFINEDELIVLHRAEQIVKYVTAIEYSKFLDEGPSYVYKSKEIKDLIATVISHQQPFVRQFIVIPFILIINNAEIALRLPNIIFGILTVIMGFIIGKKLQGNWCGLFSGLLISSNGIFTVTARADSFGVFSFLISLFIYRAIFYNTYDLNIYNESRNYVIGNFILLLGFMTFFDGIIIAGMYNLLYIINSIRNKLSYKLLFKLYIKYFGPFIIIYVLWFSVFYGIPLYLVYIGKWSEPFGQLGHLYYRSSLAKISYVYFIRNLKAINGYFFPFFSWIILYLGSHYTYRKHKFLFYTLIGHPLLWSFYAHTGTMRHFAMYFLCIIPMGVSFINIKLKRYFIIPLSVLTIAVFIWTYKLYYQIYYEFNYPYNIVNHSYSEVIDNNIYRPLDEISFDLQSILTDHERYIVFIDGVIPMYYFRDQRYLPISKDILYQNHFCNDFSNYLAKNNIRIAIIEDSRICDDIVKRTILYSNSNIRTVVFK